MSSYTVIPIFILFAGLSFEEAEEMEPAMQQKKKAFPGLCIPNKEFEPIEAPVGTAAH